MTWAFVAYVERICVPLNRRDLDLELSWVYLLALAASALRVNPGSGVLTVFELIPIPSPLSPTYVYKPPSCHRLPTTFLCTYFFKTCRLQNDMVGWYGIFPGLKTKNEDWMCCLPTKFTNDYTHVAFLELSKTAVLADMGESGRGVWPSKTRVCVILWTLFDQPTLQISWRKSLDIVNYGVAGGPILTTSKFS